MTIIDAQLHELGPRSARDVEELAMRRRILTEVTLSAMDAVGVDAALLFPVDAEWGREAAAEFPERFANVLEFDPAAPNIDELIDGVRDDAQTLGVRVTAGYPPSGENLIRLRNGAWEATFAACERHRVPVFLFLSGAPEMAGDVARAHPELQIIVDHLGLRQPPMDVRDPEPWGRLEKLLDLAVHPNIAVKACGMAALSETGEPFSDIWTHFVRVIEAFGVDRLMWASDVPRFQGRIGWDIRVPEAWGPYEGRHTYAQSLALIQHSGELTAEDKRQLLGGSLTRLLDWAPGPTIVVAQ